MSTIRATNIQPQSDSDPLVFSTNATEKLRIPSTGAISLTGGAVVSGGMSVTGNASFSGKITTASTTGSDSSTTLATKGYVEGYVGGLCLGVNQTWQNVLASRSSGVTYTNTTGRPIMVIVGAGDTNNLSPTLTVVVDGITIISGGYDASTGGGNISVSFIVPAGSTYSATITVTTISHWVELR